MASFIGTTLPRKKMSESKERIIQRIIELSTLLDGNVKQMLRSNSGGRQSRVIEIEYDVKETRG